MCNKNCCNHTHHALIFLFILCLLLLLNAQNLNLFNHKSTDSTKSSSSTTAGDGDGGSLSPCTSATTKMAMAFLSGALFALFLMVVLNNSGLSSPKNNEDHFYARGAHFGAGPSRMPYMESTDEIDDEVVEGGGVGIGYTLLRTFPTFTYSVRRPPKMGKGSPLCVICQYKFRDGELVRCLPECDHLFHLSCIDKWLTSHKTCPSCRDDLDIIANHGSTSNDSDLDSDSIWNPLYTGIVATFLTMFFIIFYYTAYACFIQFCWLPPEPEPPQRPRGGLDKAILEAYPVFTYSNVASLESNKGILECAVCLSLFEEEDTLRLLSKCNHVFHLHCVDDWLAAHTTCPLCRANLVSIHDEMMIRVESGNVDESGSMLGAEVGIDTLEKIEEIHEGLYISNIWRCNSTGHLTEIERDGDEDGERFRLRLPEAIREDFLRTQYINVGDLDSDSDSKSVWSPLYMGLVAVVSFIIFAILYYIVYACFNRFCSSRDPGSLHRARVGIDPAILRVFPVFAYSNVARRGSNKGPVECAVCLSPYEEEEMLRLLPKCDHLFHLQCVDRWLASHTTCPICRADLVSMPYESVRVHMNGVYESGSGSGAKVVSDTAEVKRDVQFTGKIWRWNSTGHLAETDCWIEEDEERSGLRTMETVRKEFVQNKLTRSFRNWLNRYQWWSASETTTQQAQGGLNPSVLESFPVFIYSEKSGLGLDKGSLECSVCLSQFEMDEKLRMLPKCKHVFHVECVNRWLVDHSTCPFCRDDLAPRPGESTQMKLGCVGGSGSRSGTEVVEGANDIV
uniref:RING-type E3 ubiquitin transferase n=1 Tax=Chenopodium quinoa TaxID=63459 RepID=A0A803KPD1_CHEQI